MPTTRFKKWAEYFSECHKEQLAAQSEQGKLDKRINHARYWKHFMVSNLVYMALQRKYGVEKVRFTRPIQDAPTLLDKVNVSQQDGKIVDFAKQIAKDLHSDDAPVPMKSKSIDTNEMAKGDKFREDNQPEGS